MYTQKVILNNLIVIKNVIQPARYVYRNDSEIRNTEYPKNDLLTLLPLDKLISSRLETDGCFVSHNFWTIFERNIKFGQW